MIIMSMMISISSLSDEHNSICTETGMELNSFFYKQVSLYMQSTEPSILEPCLDFFFCDTAILFFNICIQTKSF